MQPLQTLLPILLLAACATGDFIDDATKTLTGGGGADVKVGGGGASIGVKSRGDSPFYYVECSASISIDTGFGAGCERKWTPLFYGCVAGGAVLAALLLSCCCCCCCAPCRKRRAAGVTYFPVMSQSSSVILVNPASVRNPPPPAYDEPMLVA